MYNLYEELNKRYKIGDKVVTLKDKGSTDWQDNAEARNRPFGGCYGFITHIHDSHGLIYTVRIPSKKKSFNFEPEEILKIIGI